MGAGNVEVSQRVADVCLGALAQAVPDHVGAASQGTMNNVLLGGAGFVYYETIGAGKAAGPGRPGMNGVHTAMTNTSQVDSQSAPPVPGMSAVHTGMTNTSQVDSQSAPPVPGMSAIHTVDEHCRRRTPVGVAEHGQSGIHTGMTNSKIAPVEAFERTFPLRVRRY